MFDRLTDGFNGMFRSLSGKGSITESNVREAMAEVRTALLEADVHYDVVKQLCDDVLADALGREVTKSVKPGQEMIAIVHDRLVELLGGDPSLDPAEALAKAEQQEPVLRVSPGPTIVMMCGLQGSGKTTTCGKLAAVLAKRGRSVMLCAADLQRPAAVEQLETVARTADDAVGGGRVHFYGEPDKCDEYGKATGVAVGVCQRALSAARKANIDTLILDTAGRLHINDELMSELSAVNRAMTPQEIFLVVDAMTGQDAVNSAKAFNERLEIDGVILTKFDSDARGGAALSVRRVVGAPIRFMGVGEKIDALEAFHAERVAGRILGMGDVVSLVEKAREEVSEEEAEKLQAKMARGEMGMDDFLKQLRTLRRMGPMKQLLGMLPGVGSALKSLDVDEKQLDRVEAIVQSMTPNERRTPTVLNNSRKRRVATGSGVTTQEVSQLTKQFETVNKMAKQMSTLSAAGRVDAVRQLGGGQGPGGVMRTKGSTKSAGKKRFKKRRK